MTQSPATRRSNIATAILPMAKDFHWDKVAPLPPPGRRCMELGASPLRLAAAHLREGATSAMLTGSCLKP